jgi:myo-inositol 2-dehydrogenase/D-chiro-inositol 1-dehydrogenase/scyllo-inositol 2-dehydrogenase (NAD+)
MNKIKVCLIGCGRAGMIHARSYAGNIRAAELAAVCDPAKENLNAAQQELNVSRTYTDYREVMSDPEIDAVVVVTPTQFHREIVTAAAQSHKHVFCEKPMASTVEECDEMIEACRENGVKLQLGFMRRFDRNFRRGKEMLDSGAIGEVTLLKSNTYGPSRPKPWMFDVRRNYGPIGEVNSHDFDTLRWYAGSEVKMIHAVGHNFRSQEAAGEYPEYYDTCSVLLEFENGIVGNITGAQYVGYGYDSRTEILGTKGIIKVGSQDANNVQTITAEGGIRTDSIDSWRTLFREAYLEEDRAFIRAIIDDKEPEVTGWDGRMALLLVHEGLRSILEKRPIIIQG